MYGLLDRVHWRAARVIDTIELVRKFRRVLLIVSACPRCAVLSLPAANSSAVLGERTLALSVLYEPSSSLMP
jgi:hypothetical protein